MGDVKDLTQVAAIDKLRELAENAKMCMFLTSLDERPISARPMSVQKVDEEGNLWFFSPRRSNKNWQIKDNDEVQLTFANMSSSEYLSVYGEAEILRDQKLIDELWNPFVKTWFNEGKTDPEITLIKVIPRDCYYWDTKSNRFVQLIKIGIGAVAGKQMDDGIEGNMIL